MKQIEQYNFNWSNFIKPLQISKQTEKRIFSDSNFYELAKSIGTRQLVSHSDNIAYTKIPQQSRVFLIDF